MCVCVCVSDFVHEKLSFSEVISPLNSQCKFILLPYQCVCVFERNKHTHTHTLQVAMILFDGDYDTLLKLNYM